jgi:ABC-type multidrug transport system fused ATPase/permease subunit
MLNGVKDLSLRRDSSLRPAAEASFKDFVCGIVPRDAPELFARGKIGRAMGIDPLSAPFAHQSVLDAQSRAKNALQKFEDESIRVREASDRFYSNLALFSGGTIALSITYLGFLKSTPNRSILYPRILIAAWIVLMVCVVTSLFCTLLNSYYVHFARLRIYVDKLVEQKETFVQEMDNLYIVNLTTSEEKQKEKQRFADEAEARRKDSRWAKKREAISSALWTGFGWAARLAFPIGLGLLTFFAAKNM